jgi:hypothetical protein
LQVLLLLKGSDRVAHDLEQLQQHSTTRQQQQQGSRQNHAQQDSQSSTPADNSGRADPSTSTSSGTAAPDSSRSSVACPAQLVLRAWCVMQPEWEFRAFVAQHRLVAISQRDPSQHFPQLAGVTAEAGLTSSSSSSGGIAARLLDFHRRHIGSSFPLDSCEALGCGVLG